MIFDEWAILGGPLEDLPIPKEKRTSPTKSSPINPNPLMKKPAILSNRAKTSDHSSPLLSTRKPAIVARFSSEEIHKKFDVDAMLKNLKPQRHDSFTYNEKAEKQGADPDDAHPQLTSGASGFKVDSKTDFMSALTASLDADSESSRSNSTNHSAESLLNSFGLSSNIGPAANKRRWMTLPSNCLATIQENDAEDSRGGVPEPSGKKALMSCKSSQVQKKGDALDTELVFHHEKVKPKQFRVPRIKHDDEMNHSSSFLDNLTPMSEKEVMKKIEDPPPPPPPPDRPRSLSPNDDDIESAGTAFLDAVSRSMGFGQG